MRGAHRAPVLDPQIEKIQEAYQTMMAGWRRGEISPRGCEVLDLARILKTFPQHYLMRARIDQGDLILDVRDNTVYCCGTSPRLSRTEVALLKYFMERPNRVITRQELLGAIWPCASAKAVRCKKKNNLLNAYVSNLRRKIRGIPVRTERKVGYVFGLQSQSASKGGARHRRRTPTFHFHIEGMTGLLFGATLCITCDSRNSSRRRCARPPKMRSRKMRNSSRGAVLYTRIRRAYIPICLSGGG